MIRPCAAAGRRGGLWMALGAVALWSLTGPAIWLGGQRVGAWQLLAGVTLGGGLAQLLFYWRQGRLAGCVFLPARLWLATVLGIVAYSLLYPVALGHSHPAHAVGLNLVNYLWPILTVILATVFVPGNRMTWRLALATLLALAGLALANLRVIRELMQRVPSGSSWAPYVMVAAAACCWAMYSVLLARWRAWAWRYATAPAGFLLVGIIASGVCTWRGLWRPLGATQALALTLLALGNYGGAYLLWELALQRVRASVLGVVSAIIPPASTLLMSLATGQKVTWALGVAAGLVCCAVLLCAPYHKPSSGPGTNAWGLGKGERLSV